MKNSLLLYFLFIHSLLKIFTEEQYRLFVDSPTRGVHFIIITPITIHDYMQSREKLSFIIPMFFLLVCHHGHTVILPPISRVFWNFQNSLAFSLLEELVGRGRLKFKRGFNWTWEPCCKQIPLHFVPNRHHCFFSSNHRHFKPYGPSLCRSWIRVCLSVVRGPSHPTQVMVPWLPYMCDRVYYRFQFFSDDLNVML